MKQKLSMGRLEWTMLITLSILWGGSFFFMKVALSDLPTFTIVFCRVIIAACSLILLLKLSGIELPRGSEEWRTFFVMGLITLGLLAIGGRLWPRLWRPV